MTLKAIFTVRRSVRFAAIALAAGSLAAAFSSMPDAGASTKSTRAGNGLPVVIVHGYNASENTDCNAIANPFREAMAVHRYTGPSATFGYYAGNSNCEMRFNGSTSTKVAEAGRQLAIAINSKFGNQRVNVIAHSMGGLVTKAAIHGVNEMRAGRQIGPARWPTTLSIADLVTLGTPHAGQNFACQGENNNTQCLDMRPGTSLINATRSLPQTSGGTDYTLMGSTGDTTVNFLSAANNGSGRHRVTYQGSISHTGLRTDRSRRSARFTNNGGKTFNEAVVNGPVDHAIAALKHDFDF